MNHESQTMFSFEQKWKSSNEEVRGWFDGNNLKIVHYYEDEYGITMRGKKPE